MTINIIGQRWRHKNCGMIIEVLHKGFGHLYECKVIDQNNGPYSKDHISTWRLESFWGWFLLKNQNKE